MYNIQNPYSQYKQMSSMTNVTPPAYRPPTQTINSPGVNRTGAANNPKPMVFDQNKTAGLMAAMQRQQQGTANATDIANLQYAMKNGFKPVSTPTPSPMQSSPTPMQNPSPSQPGGSTMNATPTDSPYNPYDGYNFSQNQEKIKALREAYMAAMAKTSGETDLEGQLATLSASYRDGNQRTQDQVIPMQFITGQQESMANQYNNSSKTLTDRLALLQNERNAKAEAAKNALGFEQDDYNNQQSYYQQITQPQQVSGNENIIQYNPESRQYDTQYKAQPNPANDAKAKLDLDMTKKGYTYVKTPKERDDLKKQGYEIITDPSGRTYAKQGKLTSKTVKGKVLWFNSLGQQVNSSGSPSSSPTSNPDSPVPQMTPEEQEFKKVLDKQRDALAKGGSWAVAWNTIKNRYPDLSNQQLDEMLNKGKYYSQIGKSSSSSNGRSF